MRLSNTSASDTGLAPRTIVGVPSGLMLVDVFLRGHAGISEDSLRLAFLIINRFAVCGTTVLIFMKLMQSIMIGLIFGKQSVWEFRRFFVTAVLCGQNLAGRYD